MKIKTQISIIILLALIMPLSSLAGQTVSQSTVSLPIVTVWVHGTKPSEVAPPFVVRAMKKVERMLFYCTPGLQKMAELDMQHYSFAIAQALAETDTASFSLEHFYSFGWSGKFTPEERTNASCELFVALKTLSQSYLKEYGCKPIFILISHSHGGNVILGMEEQRDTSTEEYDFIIEKAIFLACPVQRHTMRYISSPLFKRIYSLHSHTDMVQIVDMQGFHIPKTISSPLFSERHFTPHPKLAQVCVRWKNGPIWHPADNLIDNVLLRPITRPLQILNYIKKKRGLLHVEFTLLPFIRQLPSLIKQLDLLIDNQTNCLATKDHDIVVEL